ncbi:MAG: phage major capsid protein [Clostridia bacterium]|nr:phage major capsid protein [Clostridia bacterium]
MNKKLADELRDLSLELEGLNARKEAIKKKALEHRDSLTKDERANMLQEAESLKEQIQKLEQRRAEITETAKKEKGEKRTAMNEMIAQGLLFGNNEQRIERANAFVKEMKTSISAEEIRSVLVASGGIAKPTLVGGIKDPFNELITITDQVEVIDMTGAGAYKEAFMKSSQEASNKTDGSAQSGADPKFGAVVISPEEIAVTTYVSKQLEKVSPLNYLNKVTASALVALKVKLAQKTVEKIKSCTDEESNKMYVPYNASATNGMLASGKGAINDKTLRNIVLAYGGEANVYGNATLYLSKTDLIAFGDVRGTNEKKAVYEITPDAQNPNIGTIKDGGLTVPYCIVPSLSALSGTAQSSAADVQTMIYGSPKNYELALFGDYSVEVSKDYKFAEGLLTVLGSVTTGGAIVVDKGFIVVTIPKSA